MELNSKHYAGIILSVILVVAVLVSQFPLTEPQAEDLKNQGFYEDTEDFYLQVPDAPLPEPDDKNPTKENIPLTFEMKTTGCLGEIIDNAFVPDERNPTEEEINAEPKISVKKNALEIEFYAKKYCKASEVSVNAYMDPDGIITVYEEETIDSDKFIYGPIGAPPEEIWPCECSYKTTITVKGLEKGNYPILVEEKNGEPILSQIKII